MEESGPLRTDHSLIAAGQYFVTTNSTPGTGVKLTTDTVTGYVVTTPGILIQNNSSSRRSYLRYIKLLVTNAGAGLSSLRVNYVVDQVKRFSAGGTKYAPSALKGINAESAVYVGAITATGATSTQLLMGSHLISTVIPVVNDQFLFNFGGIDNNSGQGAGNLGGTNPRLITFQSHPVVIPPGGSFLAVYWASGMSTSPSVEFEIGTFER